MTTHPMIKGGKRRNGSRKGRGKGKGSKRQNQNQNQQQNQQGGACGNSSSVAASYGGNVPMGNGPMMPQQGGAELQSSNYTAGNAVLVKGGAGLIPNMNMGGNAGLFKGGASLLPNLGGNNLIKGGNVQMPGMPTTGGNVLNELAVPAVLLYANNTFGKKRFTGKKYRGKKFRKSGKKYRR